MEGGRLGCKDRVVWIDLCPQPTRAACLSLPAGLFLWEAALALHSFVFFPYFCGGGTCIIRAKRFFTQRICFVSVS